VKLSDWDPDDPHGYSKEQAEQELIKTRGERLTELRTCSTPKAGCPFVVLQGMEASGKDGNHPSRDVPFQSAGGLMAHVPRAQSRRALARLPMGIHKTGPRQGHIGIFNRSHYEDVLVVRVHQVVPKSVGVGAPTTSINFAAALSEDSSVSS